MAAEHQTLFCLARVGGNSCRACYTAATAEEFLRAAPRGAYTVARTVHLDSVLELAMHVRRLAQSATLMIAADESAGRPTPLSAVQRAQLADAIWLWPRVVDAMRSATFGYRALHAAAPGVELKLTVLLCWRGGRPAATTDKLATAVAAPAAATAAAVDLAAPSAAAWSELLDGVRPLPPAAAAAAAAAGVADGGGRVGCDDGTWLTLACHAAPLPPRPRHPVKVEVRGAPRRNAAAKDSAWVLQRAALAAAKAPDAHEVLLLEGPNGEVLEGLSSNFFAVVAGVVCTAGEGRVLAGTVRSAVLDVCRQERIPVQLVPPRVSELSTWQGAFISSTSRLVLPVDEVAVFGGSSGHSGDGNGSSGQPVAVRRFEDNGIAHRIEALVLAQLEAFSERII